MSTRPGGFWTGIKSCYFQVACIADHTCQSSFLIACIDHTCQSCILIACIEYDINHCRENDTIPRIISYS